MIRNEKGFKKWLKENESSLFVNGKTDYYNLTKEMWNHQQKEIDALRAVNIELENAIEIIRRENGKREL